MKNLHLREVLIDRFYTYLCYDQKSDTRINNPFPNNKKHWENVKKDAENLADLVILEMKKQ